MKDGSSSLRELARLRILDMPMVVKCYVLASENFCAVRYESTMQSIHNRAVQLSRYIDILNPYRDKDNRFHYRDNSKFLDTSVHYTKHTAVTSCVSNFGITKIQKVCIILYHYNHHHYCTA